MRNLLLAACLASGMTGGVFGQSAAPDTTVYEVTETPAYPLLKSCQPAFHPGWTQDSVMICADQQLLKLLATNIRYPQQARENNLEGVVVAGFIVEKNGAISQLRIIKDIGGGCGEEAARVISALNDAGLRWQPATNAGKAVRVYKVVPIRFRLTEALPYVLSETGDSIYTSPDTLPVFKGGTEAMQNYAINALKYPDAYLDSCRTGVIEMALLVRPNGSVNVENMVDFNNLGIDFQFEALKLANNTRGKWIPAWYQGRQVATTLPFRVLFKSDQPACTSANERFDQAMLLADEGARLSDAGDYEAALDKLNKAVQLEPDNSEILYLRATLYLNTNQKEAACADFNHIKQQLGVTWFESLRKVLCGW